MRRLAFCYLLLLIVVLRGVSCLHTELFHKFPELVHKYQYSLHARNDLIEEHTIVQPLDHFEASRSQATFKQRYWVNENYWKNADGPVFLYIGGEFNMSGEYIDYGHIVELAELYGGLIFGVEHRFYGLSTFEDCLESKNLRFLSSQQALADLAEFYVFARKIYKLTDANKWIAYGGSYPGSLAAWFRIKYPHLVFGAIASSAPVQAKTDFKGYHNVVASSFASLLVGGSDKCRDNIKNAFDQVDQLIAKKEWKTLEQDFLSCRDISNPSDTWYFTQNLATILDGIVQYNEPTRELNIALVCQYMNTTPNTPYENLSKFIQYYLSSMSLPCMNNNYTSYLESLSNTTQDPKGGAWARQWTYQTCAQFGYYQTCEHNSSCVFSTEFPGLKYELGMCSKVFNIPPEEVYAQVAFTNAYYGGSRPKGSRIVFVNGSIDPWHALSVLTNQTSVEEAIFIPGTSHCANMNSDSPSDPPALRQARQKVARLIGEWLKAG